MASSSSSSTARPHTLPARVVSKNGRPIRLDPDEQPRVKLNGKPNPPQGRSRRASYKASRSVPDSSQSRGNEITPPIKKSLLSTEPDCDSGLPEALRYPPSAGQTKISRSPKTAALTDLEKARPAILVALQHTYDEDKNRWPAKYYKDRKLIDSYYKERQKLIDLHARTPLDPDELDKEMNKLGTRLAIFFGLADENGWKPEFKSECKEAGGLYAWASIFANWVTQSTTIVNAGVNLGLSIGVVCGSPPVATVSAGTRLALDLAAVAIPFSASVINSYKQSNCVAKQTHAVLTHTPAITAESYTDENGDTKSFRPLTEIEKDIKRFDDLQNLFEPLEKAETQRDEQLLQTKIDPDSPLGDVIKTERAIRDLVVAINDLEQDLEQDPGNKRLLEELKQNRQSLQHERELMTDYRANGHYRNLQTLRSEANDEQITAINAKLDKLIKKDEIFARKVERIEKKKLELDSKQKLEKKSTNSPKVDKLNRRRKRYSYGDDRRRRSSTLIEAYKQRLDANDPDHFGLAFQALVNREKAALQHELVMYQLFKKSKTMFHQGGVRARRVGWNQAYTLGAGAKVAIGAINEFGTGNPGRVPSLQPSPIPSPQPVPPSQWVPPPQPSVVPQPSLLQPTLPSPQSMTVPVPSTLQPPPLPSPQPPTTPAPSFQPLPTPPTIPLPSATPAPSNFPMASNSTVASFSNSTADAWVAGTGGTSMLWEALPWATLAVDAYNFITALGQPIDYARNQGDASGKDMLDRYATYFQALAFSGKGNLNDKDGNFDAKRLGKMMKGALEVRCDSLKKALEFDREVYRTAIAAILTNAMPATVIELVLTPEKNDKALTEVLTESVLVRTDSSSEEGRGMTQRTDTLTASDTTSSSAGSFTFPVRIHDEPHIVSGDFDGLYEAYKKCYGPKNIVLEDKNDAFTAVLTQAQKTRVLSDNDKVKLARLIELHHRNELSIVDAENGKIDKLLGEKSSLPDTTKKIFYGSLQYATFSRLEVKNEDGTPNVPATEANWIARIGIYWKTAKDEWDAHQSDFKMHDDALADIRGQCEQFQDRGSINQLAQKLGQAFAFVLTGSASPTEIKALFGAIAEAARVYGDGFTEKVIEVAARSLGVAASFAGQWFAYYQGYAYQDNIHEKDLQRYRDKEYPAMPHSGIAAKSQWGIPYLNMDRYSFFGNEGKVTNFTTLAAEKIPQETLPSAPLRYVKRTTLGRDMRKQMVAAKEPWSSYPGQRGGKLDQETLKASLPAIEEEGSDRPAPVVRRGKNRPDTAVNISMALHESSGKQSKHYDESAHSDSDETRIVIEED